MANSKTNISSKTHINTKIKKPSMYKVIILNDDCTTMDFVVNILMDIFNKDFFEANQIMLTIHNTGEGLAGVYTYEIAHTKVIEVHAKASDSGFPLQCRLEKED